MILLREQLGDVLRAQRQAQGLTLREVSKRAKVSLGYLSEIERGEKEASSELLGSVCAALGMPLSAALGLVAQRVANAEHAMAPAVLHPRGAQPALDAVAKAA